MGRTAMPASKASAIVDGSGTALMLVTLTPLPSVTDGVVVEPRPSRLPLEARKELEEVSEPARSELGVDAGVALPGAAGPGLRVAIAAAMGLPSASDGASVNVEPAPITSEVWLM